MSESRTSGLLSKHGLGSIRLQLYLLIIHMGPEWCRCAGQTVTAGFACWPARLLSVQSSLSLSLCLSPTCSFRIIPLSWWVRTDTAVCRSLWRSLLRLLQSSWPLCRDRTAQSDVVRTRTHVSMGLGGPFDTTENALFLCIYNHQITFTPISSFSASFNGNHVQNHTKPWTCPLKFPSLNIKSWWRILLQ